MIFEILSLPFMQRALFAGLFCAVLLAWIGVFVTSKKMSFVADGVAHASLAAVAFGILFGFAPLPVALIFAVLFAIVLYVVERKTTLSHDMVIGMLFTTGLAIGIILLQFHEGYVPELVGFLFGNMLAIKNSDVVTMGIVGSLLLVSIGASRRQLTFITIDPEGASLSGISRARYELLLYICTALAVVLSIKLLGIVLVSALLITPSAIGKTLAQSFTGFQLIAVISNIVIIFCGLFLSVTLDLPPGALIVLCGMLLFLLVRLLVSIFEKSYSTHV